MSISVDTINLRFNVKPDYDQQALRQWLRDTMIEASAIGLASFLVGVLSAFL